MDFSYRNTKTHGHETPYFNAIFADVRGRINSLIQGARDPGIPMQARSEIMRRAAAGTWTSAGRQECLAHADQIEYADPISKQRSLSPWLSALAVSRDLANDPAAIELLQREKLRRDASSTHRLIACTGLLRLKTPDALTGVDQIVLTDSDDGRRLGLPQADAATRATHDELFGSLREVPPEIKRTQILGMVLCADRRPAWLTIAITDQAELHHDHHVGSWLRNTIDKHPRGVRRDVDHVLGAGHVQMTTASLLIGCHRPSVETDVRRLSDTLISATEQCFEAWPDRHKDAPPLPLPWEQLRATSAAVRFTDAVLQRKAMDPSAEPWFEAQHVHDQRAAILDRLVTISCSPDDSRQERVLSLLANCAAPGG